MKWIRDKFKAQDALKIQEAFSVTALEAQILARRGATEPEDLRYWLLNDLASLRNPFLFDGMVDFCDRVLEAKAEEQTVVVFGDRDADGITASVIMTQALQELGIKTIVQLPLSDESYGLSRRAIDEAKGYGAKLIITVDCGITSLEETDYANSLGIDMLITDHHLPGSWLPDAVAVLDPKVNECEYPFADLAGCGVAAKCAWALRFAMTDLYKQTFLLIHCTLCKNETILIEAAKLENLKVISRAREEVIPGVLIPEQSKIFAYLCCDLPIYALDADEEKGLLRKAFGKGIDIELVELRGQFESRMPFIKSKSLFALCTLSKANRFTTKATELDTLVAMFSSFVSLYYPGLGQEYLEVLDLVAIGTQCDLMAMKDENRTLVKLGLKSIAATRRDGLAALLGLLGISGRELGTQDIGWKIGPVLNSAGRLAQAEKAAELLLASSPADAQKAAATLMSLNDERHDLVESTWARVMPMARESFEQFEGRFVIINDPDINRGIAGILATRILGAFKVPTIIICNGNEETASGSVRSQGAFNCRDFLSRYEDIFIGFGGHLHAAGFSLPSSRIEELCIRISEDSADIMASFEGAEETISIDATLGPEDLKASIMKTVDLFEPYGEENPQLCFLAQNARLTKIDYMRSSDKSNSNLRLTLEYGSLNWTAVYWAAGDQVGRAFDIGDRVDFLFTLSRNFFNGSESVRMTVVDMARTGTKRIYEE